MEALEPDLGAIAYAVLDPSEGRDQLQFITKSSAVPHVGNDTLRVFTRMSAVSARTE